MSLQLNSINGSVTLVPEDGAGNVNVIVPRGGLGSITLSTPIATTTGTLHDFTGIPAGTKKITVSFVGTSSSAASNHIIQLGDAGGIEISGYSGVAHFAAGASGSTVSFTTGIGLTTNIIASTTLHGSMTMLLVDAITNTWACTSILGSSTAAHIYHGAGSKSLTAELTQIRLTTVGGLDTFDAGTVNIQYE